MLPAVSKYRRDIWCCVVQEPNDVPGLQRETFYVVDDSPEARSADGGSPVKGIMTHISASGPRAFAALFGAGAESGHWSSWCPLPPFSRPVYRSRLSQTAHDAVS